MTTGPGTETPRVAVVVASIDARTTALECLSRFADEVRGRGEVVLVDASRDGTAERVERDMPGVRVIRRPPGSLAPELWLDGLSATRAPFVAFSTAAMLPCRGWLDAMLARLDSTGAAAVGGPIEPAAALSPTDRAVYLLRYVNYLRPLPCSARPEPPGDNAVYRRECLDGLGPWTSRGFWECEVHRRLLDRGGRLELAPGAVVTFQGGCRLGQALGQRVRHSRHYGSARAAGMTAPARLARVAAAPAVPAVLLDRIARSLAVRGRSVRPWVAASPALVLLAAAWAAGEALGLLARPGR